MIRWLRDEHNRGAVAVIGSVLALIVGGVWTVFVYFYPQLPAQENLATTSDTTESVEPVPIAPTTQVVEVDIVHGHYDGKAFFTVDQQCDLSGSIDWVNRVDSSTIINQVVTGAVTCRMLTVERVSVGDACTGKITSSGQKMSCRLGPHDTSFRFSTPIETCGC